MSETIEERRKLPNGRRDVDQYNAEWCRQQHSEIDKRLTDMSDEFKEMRRTHTEQNNRLEGLLFKILLALFGNVFGFAVLCLTMWMKSEGVI